MNKHNLMKLIVLCLIIYDVTNNLRSFILIMEFKLTRGSVFILDVKTKEFHFNTVNRHNSHLALALKTAFA